MEKVSMKDLGYLEVKHLEPWVVQHIEETLGEGVLLVTEQFNKFGAEDGALAGEKLDILARDVSGQLVVAELKRNFDSKIHLQGITYAALVANFTKASLGAAHAAYLSKVQQRVVTADEGLARLEDHVEDGWDDDILSLPRIALVAEKFPHQVLTTARWLERASGGAIQIECIQFDIFRSRAAQEDPLECVSFRRIWPVDAMEDRILAPLMADAQNTQKKIVEKTQKANTAKVIGENQLIPLGSAVQLDLAKWVSQEVAQAVKGWLQAESGRDTFSWAENSNKPLSWECAPGVQYSLSGLAKRVIKEAVGNEGSTIPGGNVWYFRGQSMYDLAHGTG